MESLSSVRTVLGIVQDLLSAVETASRNKSRCEKVAKRVRCLRAILQTLEDAAQDGTTPAPASAMDAATRSLLDRLEAALSDALKVVRRCQRSGIFRSVIVAGGRMADPLDGVEGEIDRCILGLGVANSIRIARLETLLRRQNEAASTADGENDDNERKGSAESVPIKKADRARIGGGAEDKESTTTAVEDVTAIGVPVCAVTAAMHEHEHEMVPPQSYGYGYRYGYGYEYWRFSRGCCTCDHWDHNPGGPSDAGSYYSSYPSMFSDDNPNACSIT